MKMNRKKLGIDFLWLVLFLAAIAVSKPAAADTMTFDSGASHTGFTFANFTGSGGTIWIANLANPATISKNSGTFDLKSYYVGPGYLSDNTFTITSNNGDTATVNTSTAHTVTLNWSGITWVRWTRRDPMSTVFSILGAIGGMVVVVLTIISSIN